MQAIKRKRGVSAFAYWVILLLLGFMSRAQGDIVADYAAIVGGEGGGVSEGYGNPGSIPVHGRAAFPLLMDGNQVPMLAAGRYGDGLSPSAGRAVAAAHTGFINTSGVGTTSALFVNSVEWAGQSLARSSITVGSVNFGVRNFLQGQGFAVKSITTGMTNGSNNLDGVDVLVVNPHGDNFSASALAQISTFAENGGGIVFASTPWALQNARFVAWQEILEPYGLSISGSGVNGSSFTVGANAYPAFHSALPAVDALSADATGGVSMSLSEKRTAAAAIDRVLAVRPGYPPLIEGLDLLEVPYGIIEVSPSANLNKANRPVEAMLARHQSAKFDSMPATDLFAHPSAEGWPGLPAANEPTVSRSFTVNGNVPEDSFINWGDRGRRIETRLYAAPGATLSVTIPPALVNAGLTLDIGCHIDVNFHLDNWRRFPKVMRSVPLDQEVVETGNVFGGLVWIAIPAGSNLGSFEVTIDGALEAPSFQLGVDTDEDWNERLKHLPGAWGVIMTEDVPEYGNTPLFTIYVSRRHLQNVGSAEAVALHWKKVMETGDELMGYGPHRRRGEAALSDIDIIAGGGHAGWPVMMAYGDSDSLVNGTVQSGDWGFYHEIGHTYQDSFDGTYGIATHGEVDVNLVPALLYTHVHDRTAWDGNVHSTFNAPGRLTDRANFLSMPANEQTWAAACSNGRPMAYDFYFNLAESYGWEVYGEALGRLIDWHRGGNDTELSALGNRNNSSGQAKRDRFYTIFCDATGRNLDNYFQRYGLGRPGLGFEISSAAKSAIAAKGYPEWTDNTPVEEIADPGVLTVADSMPIGALISTLEAIDPEDPGTIWDWEIISGGNGRVTIDRRGGQLRVGPLGLDGNVAPTMEVTVRARETTAPRFDAQRTITLSVEASAKAPRVASYAILRADSGMSIATVLGNVIATDPGRGLVDAEIIAGNPGGNAFAIDLLGRLVVATPSAIPSASLVVLTVRGTDDAGATGLATVRVLCNAQTGLREQRWVGQTAFWDQNWTGSPSYDGHIATATTAQDVGDNYSRRVSGWVVAPQTGEYTFWVASDDQSRLFVGTGAESFTGLQRAAVNGWTGYQNFDANTSQRSAPIYLIAGQAYWLEGQQAEGVGADHLSIAWSKPDGSAREVIPSDYLIPNQDGISGDEAFSSPPEFSQLELELPALSGGDSVSGSLADWATHPSGADLSFSVISGPGWLQVAADGTLSGTPAPSDSGLNQWTIRVTSADGLWAESVLSTQVSFSDPFVQLSQPQPAQTLLLDSMIALSANAAGGDFVAERVDFLVDGQVVGSAAAAPYQFAWTPAVTGEAVFVARLIHSGGSIDSDPVNVWVTHGHPVFTNPEGGTWQEAGNWLDGNIADGSDVIADFSLLELTETAVVTLDGARTLGGLWFGDGNGEYFWNLQQGSGGSISLESETKPEILVDAPGADISAILSGTQGFNKLGQGRLVLSAAGDWTGETAVVEGTMEVLAKSGDVAYVVEPGASLIFGYNSGTGYSPAVTVHGAGLEAESGLFVTTGRTLASNDGLRLETAPSRVRVDGEGQAAIRGFDINSPHHLRVAAAASGSVVEAGIGVDTGFYGYRVLVEAGMQTAEGDVVIEGPITGGGQANINITSISTGLLKTGAGSLKLSGVSSLSGGVSINEGSIILAGGDNRLPTETVVALGSGTGSAKLQLGDSDGAMRQTLADILIQGSGGSNAVVGGNPAISELTLELSMDRNFAGRFGGEGLLENNLALVKAGLQTLSLSATHTHQGDTTVAAGILELNGVLTQSKLVVNADSALVGEGQAQAGLELAGTLSPGGAGVGTFVVGETLQFESGGTYVFNLASWTGEAGISHDLVSADAVLFNADGIEPMSIVLVGDTIPVGFDGAARSFPLVTSSAGISGFDPSGVEIDASALSAVEGSWTVTLAGNDLLLNYHPINQAPSLSFDPDPGIVFAADVFGSFDLSGFANDADVGDTLSFSKQSGPAWLSISEQGVASGTPSLMNGGIHEVLVRVTDSLGDYAEASLNVQVTLNSMQQWQVDEFGTDAMDPLVAGEMADPDGDGISNLMEYALGFSPVTSNALHSAMAMETREMDGESWLVLVIQRNPDATDLDFVVESTSDLSDPNSWSSQDTEVLEETPQQLVVRDKVGGAQRFIRLRVTR